MLTALAPETNIRPMHVIQTTPDPPISTNPSPSLSGSGSPTGCGQIGILVVAALLGLLGRAVGHPVHRHRASTFIARLVGRFVVAVFMVVGFVYALNQLGVSIGPLLGLLGLAGLAMALAFQDLLGNIIAGIFMSIRRPFDAGHQVSVNGFEGTVESINLREVALVGFDGVRVHIPNAGCGRTRSSTTPSSGSGGRHSTLASATAPTSMRPGR